MLRLTAGILFAIYSIDKQEKTTGFGKQSISTQCIAQCRGFRLWRILPVWI